MNSLDAFDRILALLHQAALDDAHWPAAAAAIDEACGAVGNGLLVGEWSGDDVRIHFAQYLYRGEPRQDVAREYLEVYYPHDEARRRLRVRPAGELVHAPDLYTEKELKTSLMYNEGLRRCQSQNGFQVRLDWQDGHRVVWGIGDPVASGGWQPAQLQLIESLLPHVRQFVRVRQALVGADALSTSLTGPAGQEPDRRPAPGPRAARAGGERPGRGHPAPRDCLTGTAPCAPRCRRMTAACRGC